VREFDCYNIDQEAHRDTLNTNCLENDGKLFWILQSPEYQDWIKTRAQTPVLLLRGSPDLEQAASYIVRAMSNNRTDHLVLYFFYGSSKSIPRPQPLVQPGCDWRHLVSVWTLLKQAIDGQPDLHKQSLIMAFFREALQPITDEVFITMLPDEPKEAFERLLRVSKLENLWYALVQTLKMAEELSVGNIGSMQQNNAQLQRNLVIVLDIDDLFIESYQLLMDVMRENIKYLQRHFETVKVLVVNAPSTSDLALRQSEILLEYDKERRGLFSPHFEK
jgi:hypothetical protein